MRIGIIGLGYVGLTLAIAAADSGIEVYGIEINQNIVACLNENRAHFYEPGLDTLIKKYHHSRFHCIAEFPEDMQFDAFIITVGTPLCTDKKIPDFNYIKSAVQSVAPVYTGSELVILRSTVSVGTTRNIVMPYLARLCGRTCEEVLIGMCPERTVEGRAIEELHHLPQIISGNNEEALEIAQQFFRKITPFVIPVSSLEEAELVKLYCNTYRDMSFSIGNAFCMAAQTFGVDGISVIKHANQGYDRANIALPGFVSGPCLEKDAYILTNNMPDCDSKKLIMNCRYLNESLEDVIVQWVQDKLELPDENKVIVLSGLAFKGQPETSDLRGSAAIYIAKKLKSLGYHLHLHDFVASQGEMETLQLGNVYTDIYDACTDAAMLLVLNNHKAYKNLQEHRELMRGENGFVILDVWGVCSNLYYSQNIDIFTLGNLWI